MWIVKFSDTCTTCKKSEILIFLRVIDQVFSLVLVLDLNIHVY